MTTVAQLQVAFSTAGDQAVSGTLNALGQQVDAVGTKTTEAAGRASGLTTALGAIGTATLGAFVGGIGAASNFQFQMSAVQAVTGATQAQMKGLSQQALDLSKNSIFSAQQVGVAQEEMAKAGLTTQDMMAGATEAVIQLAHATGGDLGQAAIIAANALNQFGLSGADAGHVADVLTNAANTSALDVSDLGESLKYAAPAAHALGIGIEDTTAALSIMADAGLRGSRAGTDLKDVLLALAGPTTTQAAGLQQMGINAFDANGKFVGLGNVIKQVADATKNMTDQQRLAILEQAFGKQGAQAMIDLLNSQTDAAKKNGKAWGDYVRNMNVSGSAAKQAATRLDNFQGSLLKLKQTLTVLGIQLGSVLLGPMKAIVDAIRTMLNAFLSLPQGVQQTIAAVGLVLSAFLALKSGFGGLLPILGKISPGFAQMGESLAGLAPVLLGVAAAAGVFYLAYRTNFLGIGDETRKVVGQVKLGLGTFGTYFDAARKSGMDPFNASLRALAFSAIDAFGANSFIAKGALQVEHLGRYFTDVFKSGNTLTKSLNALPKSMRGVAQATGILVDTAHDFVRAWNEDGIMGVLRQVPAEVFDVSDAFARLIGQIPGFGPVGAALETSIRGIEQVWNGFVASMQNVQNTFFELRTNGFGVIEAAVIALSDNFPRLTDAFHSLGDATTSYVNAVKALMDAFGDFAKGDYGQMFQDLKTAAVDALSGMGDAALAVGQAILDGIGAIPWGTVTDVLVSGLQGAADLAGQAGIAIANWTLNVGAPTLFGWVLDAASWLSGKILDAVKAVAPVLAGWLLNVAAPTLFGWTLEAASWLGGKILDAVKSVAPELKGWVLNVAAPDIGTSVGTLVETGAKIIDQIAKGAIDHRDQIADTLKSILVDLPNKIGQGIGELTGAMAQLAANIVKALTDAIIQHPGDVAKAIGILIAGALALPGLILVGMGIFGYNLVKGIIQGLNDAFPGVADWFTGLGTKVTALLVDASVWLIGVGSDIVQGLKTGFDVAWATVSGWFDGLGSKIVALVLGAPLILIGIGADIISGLIAGFESAWGTVSGWLTGLGSKVTATLVDAKTWLVGVGNDVISGLKTGLDTAKDTLSGIKDTITKPFTDAKDALAKLKFSVDMSWVNDVASAIQHVTGPIQKAVGLMQQFLDLVGKIGLGSYQGAAKPTGPNVTGAVPQPNYGPGGIDFGFGSLSPGAGGTPGQAAPRTYQQPPAPQQGIIGPVPGSATTQSGALVTKLPDVGTGSSLIPDFSALIAAFGQAGQQAATALGAGLQTALTAVTAVVSAIGTIAGNLATTLGAQGAASGQAWAVGLGAGAQTALTAIVAVSSAIGIIAGTLTVTLSAQGIASGQAWAVGLGAGLQLGLTATVAVTAAITAILAGWAAATTASGTAAGSGWAVGLGAGLQRGLSATVATAAAITGSLLALAGSAAAAGSSAGAGWANGVGAGLQRGLGAASATAGAIEGILYGLAGAASGAGSSAGYGFAYGLGGGLNEALGTAAAVAGGIAGILSIDLSGEGANAGYSFAAGLASAAGAAYGAAAAIAAAAVAGASTALGIASPSKVFRNLADQTVEGYLIPLQQRRDEVADSMSALLQAPRSSATDGVLLQTLSRSQQQSSQPQVIDQRPIIIMSRDELLRVFAAVDGFHVMTDPNELKAITVKAR